MMEEKPKRRVKKAVVRRKSKKEKENPIAQAIRLTVETGKVEFGSNKGIKNVLVGKVKMVVIPKNIPSEMKEDVLRYAKLSKIPVLEFSGTSLDLGSVCGKPFPVSVLSIYDEGNSDILKLAKKK